MLTTLIDLTGPLAWMIMLVPVMVLAVIVAGVAVGRDRQPAAARGPDLPSVSVQGAETAARTSHAETVLATPGNKEGLARIPSHVPAPQPDLSGSQKSPRHAAALPREHDATTSGNAADNTLIRIENELTAADQRFDDRAVARLSLELARAIMAAGGSQSAAQSHLTRAIILASRLKDDDTHAAARLELGDLIGATGDMTTACEHWQIARQIYWDKDAEQDLAKVDRRMIANGCPTDWVLNDF